MQATWIRSGAGLAAALFLATTATIAGAGEPSASAAKAPADNTAKNERDADGATLTPDQQSNDPKDVELTRQIRRSITKDDSLSTNAHNVKIITRDRMVTLRGPVASEKEKAIVAKKAEKIAGAKKVDNQLEVAKQ
jgi:hyperosmotically inducible protein